ASDKRLFNRLTDAQIEGGRSWAKDLGGLAEAARAAAIGFKASRCDHKRGSVDPGGNTNLFKEQCHPERTLVIDGWELFERFRPNEARGTENGVFHEFLKDVVGYATGEDTEERSSISSWMKVLAALLRNREIALAKIHVAERDLKKHLNALDNQSKEAELQL